MEVQMKDNKLYAPLKDKWLVVKPEEEVRQRNICCLIQHLTLVRLILFI